MKVIIVINVRVTQITGFIDQYYIFLIAKEDTLVEHTCTHV